MKIYNQRKSYTEKTKGDNEWAKKQIDALISYGYRDTTASGRSEASYVSRYETLLRSYRLYNNKVDQSDFEREFNPFNINVGQKKDYVAPYNKAHNKINILVGELMGQPFTYRAYLVSEEGAKATLEIKNKLLDEYAKAEMEKQITLNYVKNDPEMTNEKYTSITQMLAEKYQNVMNPDQIEEYIAKEYLQPREKKANKILDRIMFEQSILDKKADSFKHGLLSDEEHAWVGELNGRLCIKILNPLGVFYHKSPDVKYIQNGDYAGYRTRMSVADILDTYKNLSKADIKKLTTDHTLSETAPGSEMVYNFAHTTLEHMGHPGSFEEGQYGYAAMHDLDVYHVEWRSQRKVGFLTYLDEAGAEQTTIVDESFKLNNRLNPNIISLEWDWIPEIWEGTRIGRDIYVDIRPVPEQTVDMDYPYEQPLRYIGVVYNNMNATPVSVMERMRPFQLLYLVVMHKWKKLISREKGNKIPIDVSMLPGDISMEQWLYYFEELDYYFYNSLENSDDPRTANRGAVDRTLVTSKTSEIINYIQILEYLDNQIGEIVGITPSREGQSSPYTPVTNNQQSILNSSNITRYLFNAHQKHWENVLNRAINCAIKYPGGAYQGFNGVSRDAFSYTKEEFDNDKYNVYIADSAKESQIFNEIKGLLQPALQNDKVKFSGIIKAIKSSSTSEIAEIIELGEKLQEEMEQRISQSQNEATLQAAKMQSDVENRKLDILERNNIRDNETRLATGLATAVGIDKGEDTDGDGTPDIVELMKIDSNAQATMQKLNLEREKLEESRKARLAAEAEAERQRKFEAQENEKDRKIERIKARKPSSK